MFTFQGGDNEGIEMPGPNLETVSGISGRVRDRHDRTAVGTARKEPSFAGGASRVSLRRRHFQLADPRNRSGRSTVYYYRYAGRKRERKNSRVCEREKFESRAISGVTFLLQRLSRLRSQDLDEIAGPLLHRTADTNRFLRADSNAALDRMVQHLPPHKTIGVIVLRGAR